MRTLQKVFSITAIALLSACSSIPDKLNDGSMDPDVSSDTAPGVGDGRYQGSGVEVLAASSSKTSDGSLVNGKSIDEMKMMDVNSIYPPIIYFNYDQYDLDEQGTEVVRYHANILIENPRQKLVLQGHTDERGTPEYNLALGEKRALAVSQAMLLFGVEESRIEVISFGEEQPELAQSNELAWQKNRRVEIIIK